MGMADPLRVRRAAVGLAILLCLAACGGSGSAAQQMADYEAQQAGIVFTNGPHLETALTAARGVIGTREPTTIDALQVQGDRADGSIVLRISVRIPDRNLEQGSVDTSCYRYALKVYVDGPHAERCPAGGPVAAGDGPALPAAAQDSVRKTLTGAASVASVITALKARFPGPRFSTRVAGEGTTIGVSVLASEGQCLFARRVDPPASGPAEQTWIVPKQPRPVSDFYCLPDRAAAGDYRQAPPPPDS